MLLLFATLVSSAASINRQRGCRVGTPNPQFSIHRSPLLSGGENPYIGNRRQLVVMASFQDQDFLEDHDATLQTWNKVFNAENYAEGKYAGSVHDYFLAQSYGQFNLTFDLVFVELPDGLRKYRSTSSHDEYSQYMVDDIVDMLQTQNIDWSLYDWDGDAFVDQLLIIYAGKGMNAGGGNNTIWPHQWELSSAGISLQLDGKKIDRYACGSELNGSGNLDGLGTICHEFGHAMGLPDFYDTDYADNGQGRMQGFRN